MPFLLEIIAMVDEGIGGVLSGVFDTFWLRLATGYTGYFVLGHYLVTYGLEQRTKTIIYTLGMFGTLLIIVGTSCLSLKNGVSSLMIYNELTPLVLFQVTSIFVLFTSKEWTQLRRHQKTLTKLSNRTFAIYLIHVMVLELTENSFLTRYPVVTIPAYVIVIFAISYAVACVLAIIPGIKNYAV
jgi:surface polysaccharide O-acyltransferase-like enzyme